MSGGSPKTQTVTQKNDPPAWAVSSFQDMLKRGNEIADTPYVPYTGQLVAGQTADQLASQDMVRAMAMGPSVISNGQGYAAGLLGGQGQWDGAMNPYFGQTNALIGGVSAGGSNPYIGAANPMIGNIGAGVGGGGGGRTQVGTNRFLGENPYLDNMIAASSRDVTEAFTDTKVPALLSQFQSGGAFGGTAMANALASEQDTLAQNLGELSNQYRFQDYQTQQALEEAGLDRSVNAQLADLARNAQSRDSAQARMLQGQIAAAQLYDQGIGRSAALFGEDANRSLSAALSRAGLYGADLDRNAGLGESALGRDLTAWGQYQGNQLSALGMLPSLNQAQYLGASMLGTQGQQQQALQQAWLDANYGQFMDARNWDMYRFNPLLQSLAAVQGGTVTQTSPYQGPSAGAGALGGAASGAAMGSMFGPIGTGVGALAGGLMGYFGSR